MNRTNPAFFFTALAATFACTDETSHDGGDDATDESSSDTTSDDESGETDTGESDESGTDTTDTDTTDTGETETGDGDEPGLAFVDLPRAVDLTPDGSIALLEQLADPIEAYFYDTASGTLTLQTEVGDPNKDFSTGISAELDISALHGNPVQAGVWNESDGWVDLASPFQAGCDVEEAGAWDIDATGTVVVGLAWNGCWPQAFRWADDSFALLDLLGSVSQGMNPPSNRASAVSDDGSVTVGFAQHGSLDRSAAMWNADGSGMLLDPDEIGWPSEALSVSADGSVIAGTRGYDGFYWTAEDGMNSLGMLPESEQPTNTFPNAIAADGSLIFGAFGDPWMTIPVAFVWTEAGGMQSLAEIAVANGLELPAGYLLVNVLAASADGSVVIGTAWDDLGATKSFVLRLGVDAYGL